MDRRPRVGIRDVAEAAGVSKSTASRALRGESRVSEETIAHVERVAASLGYVPDLRAAGLSSAGPTAVGLMLRGAERSFYGEIAARVQSATDDRGMDLLIVNGGDDYESQLRGLRNLIGHRVAGVLIASGRASLAAAEEAASFLPTVLVGLDAQHEAIDSVSIAPESETEMARAVLSAGHRRIAVTSPDRPESTVLVARAQRYRTELAAGGAAVVDVPAATDLATFARGLRGAIDDGVTAFMALDDTTAVAALELLAEWGEPNPGRLSVTGFDGVGLFGSPLIGLSTMRQPVGEMANAAADLMMARIAGDAGLAQHLTFAGERIAGRTLGAVG
jgi:DNA-binding LacI/PurR family transcriptional regulator